VSRGPDVTLKLSELIARKDANGKPIYTLEQIKDAFAVLLMSQNLPPDQLSSEAKIILAQFAAKIGFVGENATAAKLLPLMDSYLKNHPVQPELMQELRVALQE